ncbi:MAG: glycosyltransferase [Opitutae bacterium]|nr:glycosyltransferase [Opitutae bacterium]
MIAAAIASYEREPLLRRLLGSLRECPALRDGLIVIVNNGTGDVATVARETGWPDAVVVMPGRNLGCAGGVALAISTACARPEVQHVLVLDDDAWVAPEAPGRLRETLEQTGGGLAVPLVSDAAGRIGWFPGLCDRKKWRVVKQPGLTPDDYVRICGAGPVRFTWAAWPILMLSRRAIVEGGLPLAELFYQGVDLEYTLRQTTRFAGYLVPTARAAHLPPPITADRRHYLRECAGLQNSFYVFIRLPHGRRALRHLPGNVWRFLRLWGYWPRVLADVLRAFWWGAVRAKPQGADGYNYFLQQWERQRT